MIHCTSACHFPSYIRLNSVISSSSFLIPVEESTMRIIGMVTSSAPPLVCSAVSEHPDTSIARRSAAADARTALLFFPLHFSFLIIFQPSISGNLYRTGRAILFGFAVKRRSVPVFEPESCQDIHHAVAVFLIRETV